MGENGIKVNTLHIGAMCRDWSKQKFQSEDGYPDQIEYIEIPLWNIDKQLAFIESRIEDMALCMPCSQAERWQDDTKYAVWKKGGKRALKVEKEHNLAFDYCEDKGWMIMADDGVLEIDDDHYIETRVMPNRRCMHYCSVNKWCEYYNDQYMTAEEIPFK